MQIPLEARLLRIYEVLVLKAREMHQAGATVLRGPMGYGHSRRLHTDIAALRGSSLGH